MKKLIHWNEGLFLQPQHFQLMQRQMLNALALERNLMQAHAYGIVGMRICEDSLANKMVRFEQLCAVMPSGTYVELGENLALKNLDIRERFSKKNESFHLYLGIPVYSEGRANTVSLKSDTESNKKYLYHIEGLKIADENTGEQVNEIELLFMQGQILIEGDSFDGFEVIPLFRVMQGVGENLGQPRIAPDYCGPCMMIKAFAALQRLIAQLFEQISASRKDIFRKFRAQGFNREQVQSSHLDLMLRCRTLFAAEAALSSVVEAGTAHPLDVFNELKGLFGQLVSLNPDAVGEGMDIDPFSSIEEYEHSDPFMSLKVLAKKIREVLGDIVIPDYLEVAFERLDDHYRAFFEGRHFAQSDHFFIGIESKTMPPQELKRLVEDIDVFKFVPASMKRKVLRGVRLKEEIHVPHFLPRKSYLYYFRILPGGQGSVWNKIEKEKEAIIEWNGVGSTDFKIRCFMTTIS